MAYVPVPKDLTRVKSKFLFNLTKRQVVCFGLGALVGLPVFFLTKGAIGVSMAAAWLRQGGLETTHLTHILAFLTLEMIPASTHKSVSPLGASVLTGLPAREDADSRVSLGVENDEMGIKSAQLIMQRALELSKLTHK